MVVELDDMRPHCTFLDPVTGNAHVVPLSLVARWASEDIAPDPECVRAIISDWLADL